MVAYLEKTDGNAEFHEINKLFLIRTTSLCSYFAGKPVLISEASIRSDLQFNDVAGIDVLPNQAIFDTIHMMGYEGDLNTLTFNKGISSPQWKFLFHTIIHYLSSKSTSWDQIPTNIATVVICLATNQVYNFSKLFFDGMMRHLDAKKKFVIYPRFIPIFLTNQLKNVHVPLDHFPINALTTKPDPFLRPSSSNPIPDSIPEGSGGNHGAQVVNIKDLKAQIKQLKKKARPVINHHKAWIKSLSMKKRLARKKKMEFVSKQGRKTFKSVPTVHKDLAFDDLDDAMDYIETPNEGTAEPKDGNSDESAAPTTIFRDDETIAQFLVTMSQNKTNQKGVEIKEIKDTNRPRTTTKRSILTLKPLPKIDPKDKGKKVSSRKKVEADVNTKV
ncbi:hypothetical protein Tco_0644556 [Tanacetum coccineum]